MRIKKILALALATVMAIGCFAGCNENKENEKGEKITKTIPLSPRPDGFPTYTLRHAKRVHKIKW